MDFLPILAVSVALSLDCFTVGLAIGTASSGNPVLKSLVVGIFFGGFQAGMTLAGFATGVFLTTAFLALPSWIAALLLLAIGIKIIFEGLYKETSHRDKYDLSVITVLALATSIDAFAVGVAYSFLDLEIVVPAIVIGIVAFAISVTGVLSGRKLKDLIGESIIIVGGLILIGMAASILLFHA
ncbi:MAG TPA: manganese efflux pump [Methanoregulaceae archaeon]|nr:manganese efflux pump [Methanoregulaceae archaeon]